jgi:hypothetical protein
VRLDHGGWIWIFPVMLEEVVPPTEGPCVVRPVSLFFERSEQSRDLGEVRGSAEGTGIHQRALFWSTSACSLPTDTIATNRTSDLE